MKFMDENRFAEISLDGDQSDGLIKLLDSFVIILEGGTELDLSVSHSKKELFFKALITVVRIRISELNGY